ncbi:putative reverse transcriptase domain-containing protein [Tanacetum coccineum]
MCDRMFPEEINQVEKYVGGLPDTIHGSVMATKPKTMQDAIEFATELMDKKINTWAEHQADNKRKSDDTARNNQNQQPNKRQNTGRAYATGNDDRRPYGGLEPLCVPPICHPIWANMRACFWNVVAKGHFRKELPLKWEELQQPGADRSFVSTAFSSRIVITLTALDHDYNVELANGFDVIIGMDWLAKYHAVIVCAEKIIRIPFGDEILIVRGDGSSNKHGTRLNIISCAKAQEYLTKGCHVFLANITTTKDEDKSKENTT